MVLSARALLFCDANRRDAPWTTAAISAALGMPARAVERLKRRFDEHGLDQALEREPLEAPSRAVKFDGAFEAAIAALARSEPPAGRSRWTVRLLAEKAVELKIADSVSPMTAQRALKKANSSLIRRSAG